MANNEYLTQLEAEHGQQPANPYLSTLEEERQQRTAALRGSLTQAVSADPEQVARQRRVASYLGYPTAAVQALPGLEQRAKLQQIESTLADAPKTRERFTDSDFAKLAHDDVDNMTTLERIGGGLKATAKYLFSAPDAKRTLTGDVGAGLFMLSRGAAGLGQAAAEVAAPALDVFERPDIGSPDRAPVPFVADLPGGNPLRRLAEGFGQMGADARTQAKSLSPEVAGIVEGGVSSGVQSLTQNLALLPFALVNAPLTLLTMAAVQGGQSFQDAREKGVSLTPALTFATSQAAIEFATEKLPLHKLIGDIKAGTPLFKSLVHNAALEIPGEQVATVLQDLNEWAVLNPDKPFSSYLEERPSAAAQTLIATLIGVGGNVTLGHAMQKAADNAMGVDRTAQQAEAHAQVLQEFAKLAEASKVRERDPAAFASFAQSLVEDSVPNVYVDAKTLLQSADLQQIAEALPSVAEQIQQAAATGGDVVIPTQELLTAGPGQSFMQSLVDNARTAPEAMSAAEAREYMQTKGDQLKADIEQVLGDKQQDQQWADMRDQLRDEFKAQLDGVKRFTSDVNLHYANLLANFYAVTAAKLGVTPQELAAKYGLQMRAQGVEGGVALDQGGVQTDTPEFKAWFGNSKAVGPDGKPLVVYHGSPDLRFLKADGAFKSQKERMGFGFDKGAHWFTPSRATAKTYADPRRAFDYQNAEEGVVAVHLKLENPLIVDAGGQNWRDAQKRGKTSDVIQEARKAGHDGVIIRDVKDDYNNGKGTRSTDTYVVFDSTQIKSATDNRGTFDPNDASIFNQFAGAKAKTADTHALTTAQARIEQGDDAETVRRETGWHKGADGKWRFEISDHEAKLLPALQSLKDGGHEAKPVKSITYRESSPGRWDVTLNPTDPKEVGDFVDLLDVDAEVLRAILPENAVRAIERGVGFEDYMGNMDPAKGLGFSFMFDGMNALPLEKVLDHPRLFAAYPQLRDTLVQVDPKLGVGGAFVSFQNGDTAIRVGRGQQLTTLLHEIQHGIQSIEGFATGGSPKGDPAQYSDEVNAELRGLLDSDQALADAFDKWAGFQTAMDIGGAFDASAAEQAETTLQALPGGPKAMDLWGTLDGLADPASADRVMQDRYLRLAGEVEARNTQSRANLDEWDRQFTRIDATADTPADQVIVVFDGKEMASAPAPANAMAQEARGSINLPEDLTRSPAIISLFKGADLSTFIHESGHFFLEVQMDLAARIQAQAAEGSALTEGEQAIVNDANTLLAWMGVKGSENTSPLTEWHSLDIEAKRPMHEQFARGFEAYAFEGNSPSAELAGTFAKFRAWLLAVYKELKALRVELTDDVRGVMDRMLASTQAIQEAEAARRMGPLFKTAEQAGMTLDEFKAYHALATEASQTAIEELQARGLRDMQWLQGAKARKLKDMQKLHDSLRREVRAEVRAEVMSQPVYRAWQFLTGKGEADETAQAPDAPKASKALDPSRDSLFTAIAKLGGLRKEDAIALWGLDPKERLESGVFGAPVLRTTGGLDADTMGERLLEAGYLTADENGKHDPQELEEAFDSERRGDPVFSLWHQYERPDAAPASLPENVAFGKLDLGTLTAMSGKDAADTLKARKMTRQSGIHPDAVAEAVGFESGDQMVKALLDAEAPQSVIEGMTDQRMLERYGDLGTPEGLQRAADRAIHNEVRARFVASEIKALEKGMRVRQDAGVGARGQRVTTDLLAQVARQQAERIIGATRVKNLRPSQYTTAEARAAKAAERAMLAGNTEEALAEKRHQLINLNAAREAVRAQEEVEKIRSYLSRFNGRPKGLDADYYDQIAQLLERFDPSRTVTLKEIGKRKTLAAWVESQREQGLEPDIPADLLDEAYRTSYKDMTVDELRGLRDTVRQIERLGRLKNTLLTAKQLRDFQAVRDHITDSILANANGREADTRTPAAGTFAAWFKKVKDFGAAHIKAATWARVFDGGKDGGPVWEYFIRPANEAADMETRMRGEATEKLAAILEPVLKAGRMDGKGKFFASIGRSMNREQVFAMALNMGNEGNIQRMLDGEGWTINQIQPVLATLSASDWQAVQAVWDHFETYRPLIAAKERRIYGKEPDWVEPMPLLAKTADGQDIQLRGGYYPVKYDPLANNRAEQHADAEDAKRQMQAAYTSATTRRGFTKARADAVKGRPLLYSLQGVYSGVNDVIHDLAFHEWLIDVNKLLRSDKINDAIRTTYGPEAVRQLKTWIEDTARGEAGLQAELDSALGRLRQGVSVAGLGFNVMSAIMQPLGLTQSIVRVGAPWIGKGLAQYVGAPVAKTREVNAKSDFMAGRARTRFRELNELRNQVEGQSGTREFVGRYGYFLMMRMQQAVDVPTWLGAYEKAMADGQGEDRAIALADQAVIDAQGGGQTKDLSAIERGGPAQKLFTVFYSFMNTALNIGVAQTMTEKSRAKLAADYLLLFTVPAVLGAVLKDALTPGDSGDWDSWEAALKKLLGEQIGFLFGLLVVAREFGEAAKSSMGLVEHSRDYSGPAGVRMIADTYGLAKQVSQGELDDAFRKQAVNVLGDLLGLPSAQINRTITGAEALADGQTENPAALLFGYQKP